MEEKHKEEGEVCRAALREWMEEEKESVQQEVRRLQELRRYIQEECDQLLLRKERLKEEVEQLSQTRLEARHHSVASNGGSSSAPASLNNPYNSVASAYQVILADITREKGEIEGEARSYPLDLVQQRLEQQVNRCKQLQSALALRKAQAARIMEDKRLKHQEEMSQLEGLVNSSQALVTRQNRRFIEQMDRMVSADHAIEQLLTENNSLTLELKKLKNKLRVNK